MGQIICGNCGNAIDVFSTDKVTTYYSFCKNPRCWQQTVR
ncbi:GapA-binding peptide SR1P [Gracilibacillus timonensis]|nr:GapA-binding peptide SR1P [Gracilibacillus timonensis]